MIRACASPVSFDTLALYWAGELAPADADAVEEHVMGCAECTRASARVAAITEAVRQLIPPFVNHAKVDELRARGLRIEENAIPPGVETPVRFAATLDLLIHRLSGLDLADAERVEVVVRDDESGNVMLHSADVPFDAASGEILIACNRHFAAFPPRVAFDVKAVKRGGNEEKKSYLVPHAFEVE